MKKISWKRLLHYSVVSVVYVVTIVLSLVALMFAIPASASRKVFDYLINLLLERDSDTGDWMFVHPVDILIQTIRLLKPPVTKGSIGAMFRKSDPTILWGFEHNGPERVDPVVGEPSEEDLLGMEDGNDAPYLGEAWVKDVDNSVKETDEAA